MAIAQVLVWTMEAYAAAGLLFALVFVVTGIERVDSAGKDATLGFRLIILPGVAAFWPLLLRRWLSKVSDPPIERNAHRDLAREKS